MFQGLIKRYPDINADHLTALLNLREDMAKTNVRKVMIFVYQLNHTFINIYIILKKKQQVTDMMSELKNVPSNVKTVFSDIEIN